MQVIRILTEGGSNTLLRPIFVLSYTLYFEVNIGHWNPIRNADGSVKLLSGNTDANQVVAHELGDFVVARGVFLYIETCALDGCELKWELHGCPI